MIKNTLIICFGLLLFSACNQKESETIQVITPEEMLSLIESGKADQLIDVRTPEEFFEGHLKNAQNICVSEDDFEDKIRLLDKSKPVYIYCRSGARSADAANKLEEMGFTKIYDMQGGIQLWQQEGMDVEK